tara:strand:- start:1149 stop:1790 length:642 start_codon:yes stop_codon:yes gene_type:complete
LSVTKNNNIEKIKNFLIADDGKCLLINQVSEDIGSFYSFVINSMSINRGLKLVKETDNKNIMESNDLFGEKKVMIFNLTNQRKIEELCSKSFSKIIISDYKNYKKFLNELETINGYGFEDDIRYYLRNYFNIEDDDLINYCISYPYFTNSEITKYNVNKNNYKSAPITNDVENFILEIRKDIFRLKKSGTNIKKLFYALQKEVKYKKFSFLIY